MKKAGALVPEVPADMNELVDADIPRVDLVGKAANGHTFILAKSAANAGGRGLFPKELVEEHLAKAKKDLDVTEALADQGGAEALQPGSADWEATDAATAQKWIAILHRAKYAAELLASREATEYALNGDWDDADNEWDLQDVAWCLDSAIATLAAYAAGEQGEVALAEDGVVKSVLDASAGIDPMAIAQVELLVPLIKAGRVLSSANEADLRDAAAKIEKVLAQLPAAPEAEAPVEKGATAPETAEKPADVPVAPEAPAGVEKADGEALVAVYTQDGELIGAVKPDSITELSTGKPAEAPAEAPAEEPAPAAPSADPAAAAPAAAVVPGTDTVQSPVVDDDDTSVNKSTQNALIDALREVFAPFAEAVDAKVQKAAEDVQKATEGQAELRDTITGLEALVKQIGAQPDDRRSPVLNGGTGVAGLASRGGLFESFEAEDAALTKSIEEARTREERIAAQQTAAFAKIRRNFQ
jgi:hypothetical protein